MKSKMQMELHETERGFEPSNERTEDFAKRITGADAPYDDNQLGAIGMSVPDLKLTRKDDER